MTFCGRCAPPLAVWRGEVFTGSLRWSSMGDYDRVMPSPASRFGIVCALGAAVLFGASTPLAKLPVGAVLAATRLK